MPPATIAGVRLRSRPAQHAAIAITAVSTGATRSYIISSPDLGARLNSARSLSRVKKSIEARHKILLSENLVEAFARLEHIVHASADEDFAAGVIFPFSARDFLLFGADFLVEFGFLLSQPLQARRFVVHAICVRGRLAPYYHGTGLRARPRAKRELVIRLFL